MSKLSAHCYGTLGLTNRRQSGRRVGDRRSVINLGSPDVGRPTIPVCHAFDVGLLWHFVA